MDNFLEWIKNIIKSDPSLLQGNFSNFLYTQLISYNLGNYQEPFKDTSSYFYKWMDRNKDNEKLKTFVSEKWTYFCQFVNRVSQNITEDAIKLYIPLDESHLYEGANKIFDFIANEGIIHNSKIGKKIRNDNLVVRVSNIEEAKKVIEFVKNDSYIKEGLLNVNPFTVNIDGVGIAKDGNLSYNTELCNHLTRFINILVTNNRIDSLNMSTLHEYLDSVKDFGDKDLQLITKLLCEVTNGRKLNLEDFINLIQSNGLENKEDIFKSVVEETYNKYGLQHTVNAIATFRFNGNARGFTRDNGAREKIFMNNITLDDVNNYLCNHISNDENIIISYINSIVSKKDNLFILIENAYKETYYKYNAYQASYALERFILNGEIKFITNNNNARTNIKQIDHTKAIIIIKEALGIDTNLSEQDVVEYFISIMEEKYKNIYQK